MKLYRIVETRTGLVIRKDLTWEQVRQFYFGHTQLQASGLTYAEAQS